MNEFQLIKYLTDWVNKNQEGVIKSIGDDTAVLEYNKNNFLIITTDSLIEGTHFKFSWKIPIKNILYSIGFKAVAINISDIYAMAGSPKYFLVSISAPKNFPVNYLKMIYNGIKSASKYYNVELIGGNTTSNSKIFFIDVTMLGIVNKNNVLYRNNARTGDFIYINGELGNSRMGLELLNRNSNSFKNKFVKSFLLPHPFINWSEIFKIAKVNSAIDVSDGFVADLNHILNDSLKGAEIYLDYLPVDNELKKIKNKKWQDFALYGGEDYKIIFTSPDEIKLNNIYKIGKILNNRKIYLVSDGEKKEVKNVKGYMHFR